MKKLMLFALLLGIISTSRVEAQYTNYDDDSYASNRYFYDDDFDWHWDIRVRISDGTQRGLLTSSEANRLYRRLEEAERKEYAYLADGYFDNWEQEEIWEDVVWLNRRLGMELYDNDRVFYGFSRRGLAFRGYPNWYYHGGFDFYRFDRRGFGNVRNGYAPRHYSPKRYAHHDNRKGFDNNRNWENRNRNPRETYTRPDNRNRSYEDERGKQRNGGNTERYNNNNNNRNGSFEKREGTARSNNGNNRSSVERDAPMTPRRSETIRGNNQERSEAPQKQQSRGTVESRSPNDFNRAKRNIE